MDAIQSVIVTLGIPSSIAIGLVAIYGILQLIGELVELSGKVVPEFFKIRKYFQRKKKARQENEQVIKEVKDLLEHVHQHYSADNIQQRNDWMEHVNQTIEWVTDQSVVYDNSITEIKQALQDAATALNASVEMTETMFIEMSRDRIIDFAEKVSDPTRPVSREEFNRIFKVYDAYEVFLEEHHRTNGEVEVAHEIITEAYAEHIKNRTFTENIRQLNKNN